MAPFKDEEFNCDDALLDTAIDWIPGMKDFRLRDIPYHPNEIMFDFMGSEAQNCLKSSAILFNTFDEFEHGVLEAISSTSPNIYTIGPLSLLCRHIPTETPIKSLNPSLWKEDSKLLEWLDRWQPKSVVYVNYGSVTVMTEHHLQEFAWGLANSKHPFLWVVRPDVVNSDSVVLPDEFLEKVKDRGYIASWAPQEQVWGHESVGVFLTHCGWNSMLESVCEGVPVICWPFFADQQTNCGFACDIERVVRELMEGGVKGKELKEKALEWRKKAIEATDIGGTSYANFNRLMLRLVET